jgi:predicted DNA-binding transcriptional regulator YafY
VLRFSGDAVKYVRERTWHPSQSSEVTPEGDLIVGLVVSHLREVERWVLSWGAECLAVEPVELKDRVARALAEAGGRYMRAAGPSGRPSIAPIADPDFPSEVTQCP